MNDVIDRILDLSKSYEEADFLHNIFGQFRQDAISGNIPVVLFGAGSAGKELYPLFRLHGVNPVCFCDNDPKRQGELCCGIQVISPDELNKVLRDSLIIVTTARHCHEIKTQLVGQGFLSDRISCINEEALTRYYSHVCLSHWTYDDLMTCKENLLTSYNLMCDDKSRQFFVKYLSIVTGGSDYGTFCEFIDQFADIELRDSNVNESYLYFNTDIINLSDNEILIDCGAYNGDSAIEFVCACAKRNVTYNHIYCFSPIHLCLLICPRMCQHILIYLLLRAVYGHIPQLCHSQTLRLKFQVPLG